MKETILVTGGAGFIGSHVVNAFLDEGYEVAIIDDLHTGKRENINPKARFYETDIRDAQAVQAVFGQEKPKGVAHLAAWADVRGSIADPSGYAHVNIIGTINLLEAARQNGTAKMVFASTGGAIYGNPPELPASEDCPPHPLDPYGASKFACEQYFFLYRYNYGLDYCALRFPNVYGPRQDPFGEAGVVAIFTGKMLRGEEAVINGDGRQQRDFVFVGDVARANVLAMKQGSGIYNIGSARGTDINTIFDELARLTGYQRPAKHGPAKLGEVDKIYLDYSRAERELGWQPRVPVSEGLAQTVAYFRDAS